MSRQLRQGRGPVWAFEKMWYKPHYNQATYISNAPGVTDATGDFLQDPPISDGSSGPIWAFQKSPTWSIPSDTLWEVDEMWNKPHYNEGDYISDRTQGESASGDFLDPKTNEGKITEIHYPWCGYWYKG